MLTDRYGLPLSTTSTAARDDYVLAADQALTFYPGAAEAYDRAIAAEPGFALAYAGKAQVLIRQGEIAAAQAALAAAKGVSASLSEREASRIRFFDLVFACRTEAAIAALYPHLRAWPRDALVVSVAANPNGVIGGSGRIGQKRQIAEMIDGLAPHYGDDFWFMSYHAMALSEDGQLAAARAKIEQSVAANSNNAHGAHGFAHVCYESGDPDTARAFLSSWLATYPRDGFFYDHLSWHLSLCEIQAGNWEEALRTYQEAIVLDRHSGGPQQKISDGAAFLWRAELAGHPRDPAAWLGLYEYANSALPRPGNGLRRPPRQSWLRRSWEMMPRAMPVPGRYRNWRAGALSLGLLPSRTGARLCVVRARGFFRRDRGALRIPAAEIEELVSDRVHRWLLDPRSIYKSTAARLSGPSIHHQRLERVAEIGKHWPELPVVRKRAVLAALIERIEVSVDQIDIRLRPPRLGALLDGGAAPSQGVGEEESELLSVPVRLRHARAGDQNRHGRQRSVCPKPDARW